MGGQVKRILLGLALVGALAAAAGHAQRRAGGRSARTPSGDSGAVQPPLSPAARAALEAKLAEARAVYEKNPSDAEAIIWLGRRTAYLGRFDEAIEIFTGG